MKKMNGLIDYLLYILSFSAIKTSRGELKKKWKKRWKTEVVSKIFCHR